MIKSMALLLIASTATVAVVEVNEWNKITMEGSGGGMGSAVPFISKEGTVSLPPPVYSEYIKYLRMEVDTMGNVRVVDETNIPGRWRDRDTMARVLLSYQIKDKDGNVLHKDHINDPRYYTANGFDRIVGFVLTMPYKEDADRVEFYQTDKQRKESRDQIKLLASYEFNVHRQRDNSDPYLALR